MSNKGLTATLIALSTMWDTDINPLPRTLKEGERFPMNRLERQSNKRTKHRRKVSNASKRRNRGR